MKKNIKKKIIASIACVMACLLFSIPVMAASDSFSKTTTKLNAINGGKSNVSSLSSGSVLGDNPEVTTIKLFIKVSSGTDPYTLYVKSPEGTLYSMIGPTSSKTVSGITAFKGENPSGTWKIYIVNSGTSTNGNLIPTSTVTVTLTVNYTY